MNGNAEISQFLRFLLAGGTSVICNFAARHALGYYIQFEVAVALAYLVGMLTAYAMMYVFVFPVTGRGHGAGFGRFAIVNLFSLAAVFIVSVALARIVFPAVGFHWYPEDVAHFLGLCSTIVTGYIGHRMFTFAPGRARAT